MIRELSVVTDEIFNPEVDAEIWFRVLVSEKSPVPVIGEVTISTEEARMLNGLMLKVDQVQMCKEYPTFVGIEVLEAIRACYEQTATVNTSTSLGGWAVRQALSGDQAIMSKKLFLPISAGELYVYDPSMPSNVE